MDSHVNHISTLAYIYMYIIHVNNVSMTFEMMYLDISISVLELITFHGYTHNTSHVLK